MEHIDDLKKQWDLLEKMEGYDTSMAAAVDDQTDVRSQRLPVSAPDPEPAEDGWAEAPDDFDGSTDLANITQRAIRSERYNMAFYRYMRQRGMEGEDRQALNQVRAMVEGVDADGGFLAPTQLIQGIRYEEQVYQELSPKMNNINTSARSLTFTKGLDTIVMGWVAELGTSLKTS